MRRWTLVLLMVVSSALGAEEAPNLYSTVAPQVVFLKHEFRFDFAKSPNAASWKRLEDQYQGTLVDGYFIFASGTGFFVDDQGHIITNRHVAALGDTEDIVASARQAMVGMINRLADTQVPQADRKALLAELPTIFTSDAYQFVAYRGSKPLGTVHILKVSPEDRPDLAAVELPGYSSGFLPLAPDAQLGAGLVGTDVASFGYPLGDSLNKAMKESVVTMNKGSVSAFRSTQDLDIQHNAAISVGNSGGPLTDFEGRVVGVNTALYDSPKANSLFFAVSAKKIRSFLTGSGLQSWILWNERLQAKTMIPVAIDSNPSGAEVRIDGRYVGTTPLQTSLPADRYWLQLKKAGIAFPSQKIEVKDEALDLDLAGRAGSAVTFKNLSSEQEARFAFTSEEGVFRFDDSRDLVLGAGDYHLLIEGVDGLEGISIPVAVGASGAEVDLNPYYKRADLQIRGFRGGAQIWVDGSFLPESTGMPLRLPIGSHLVGVWSKTDMPLLPAPITVRSDGNSFITWKEATSPQVLSKSLGWTGWTAMGVGTLGIAGGIILGLNSVALSLSQTYDEYTNLKQISTASVGASATVFIVGLCLELVSGVKHHESDQQKKEFGL